MATMIDKYRKKLNTGNTMANPVKTTPVNLEKTNTTQPSVQPSMPTVNTNTAVTDTTSKPSSSNNNNMSSGDSSYQSYYDLLNKQAYDELLNVEIQLENSKNNALKYMNNQIAASGFGSQGYGSSQQSGVYNSYLNALASANEDYSNTVQENNINSMNENFESVGTLISGATDLTSLNDLLTNYGYGSVDSEGNFKWGEKPADMSNNDWYLLQYLYANQKNSLSSDSSVPTYTSMDDLVYATYTDSDGNTRTLWDGFSNVLSDLLWDDNGNVNTNFAEDTTIRVRNKNKETIYLRYTSNGWQIVDRTEYEDSDNKIEAYTDDNKKITINKVK